MMAAKSENKLNFRQHLGIFMRGIKVYKTYPKPVMASIAISSILEAAVPFINIYFAAAVLSELAGARSIERLIMLVSLTVGLNLLGFFNPAGGFSLGGLLWERRLGHSL
jgi:hypothetical protein